MNKRKIVLVLSLLVAGLSASPASADEHVNLWPIYMYENGTHDFIWPLGNYKSSDDWRFFPVIKDRSLFCVFPEFWFGSNEFAVLPFYGHYDFSEGVLFPIAGWEKNQYKTIHSIFPLYWYSNRPQSGNFTFWAACGMGGYAERDGKMRAHWALPFYCAWDDGDFFSIPYSKSSHYSGTDEAYFCGTFGRTIGSSGTTTDHWFFPFYGKIGKEFISIPYYRERLNEDSYNWFSLPLLSGGEVHPEKSKGVYLLGLAGYSQDNIQFENWCAPLYYANNRGTLVTALYGQTDWARWGLPGWYRDEHVFASPLWYHHTDAKGEIDHWILPWLLSGGVSKNGVIKKGFLLNVAGTMFTDKGYFASWCLPLYFWDNEETFISLLYGHNRDSQWCFPLWYCDEDSLFSFLWCHEKAKDGSIDHWVIPPFLSGGTKNEAEFLLGLAGYNRNDDVFEHWCAPLYYANDNGSFVTPLFGTTKDSNWFLPLWYAGDDAFVSLPYAHYRERDGQSDTYVSLPLLSGYTKYDDGRVNTSVLLLYGHGSDAKGNVKRDYLFPIYHYNGESGDFTSILYGRNKNCGCIKRWWVTPLVGTYSGSKTGGWLFPLFSRKKDNSYDADLKRLDAPTIPEDITFSYQVHSWTNALTQEVSVYTNVVESLQVCSHIRGSFLLGSDHDRSVRGRVSTPFCGRDHTSHHTYELLATSKAGNLLFFKQNTERAVFYDIGTRQKTYEQVSTYTSALCGLLFDNCCRTSSDGLSFVHTGVLGKLWDRKEENGRVTIDAFPAFSYERKSNGSTMTSFLWRFYRYGVDMEKGITLDLFFIPICRPR